MGNLSFEEVHSFYSKVRLVQVQEKISLAAAAVYTHQWKREVQRVLQLAYLASALSFFLMETECI